VSIRKTLLLLVIIFFWFLSSTQAENGHFFLYLYREHSWLEIIAGIGVVIITPLFFGIFILAATEALYSRFINPERDWFTTMSNWVPYIAGEWIPYVVAWIIGALSLLFLYFLGVVW